MKKLTERQLDILAMCKNANEAGFDGCRIDPYTSGKVQHRNAHQLADVGLMYKVPDTDTGMKHVFAITDAGKALLRSQARRSR